MHSSTATDLLLPDVQRRQLDPGPADAYAGQRVDAGRLDAISPGVDDQVARLWPTRRTSPAGRETRSASSSATAWLALHDGRS